MIVSMGTGTVTSGGCSFASTWEIQVAESGSYEVVALCSDDTNRLASVSLRKKSGELKRCPWQWDQCKELLVVHPPGYNPGAQLNNPRHMPISSERIKMLEDLSEGEVLKKGQ